MFRAMADSEVGRALKIVLEKVALASKARPQNLQKIQPRLVAVSKTKPISLIKQAYGCGQRNFGENYVQELEEKGHNTELLSSCGDIKWHFIGNLQRNKINKVLGIPNIFMIETITTEKLATAVNNAWERLGKGGRLSIMVQVNTSGEENKNGCEPSATADLVNFVLKNCPQLELRGLMTIGAFDHDLSKAPNPDFQCLVRVRDEVCEKLGVDIDSLELSMGMSNDYEHAISVGSTNVRVGSTIFGARLPKKPQEVATTSQDNGPATETAAKLKDLNVKE